MADEEPDKKQQAQGERMAMGIAMGVPLGVAISLVLDNWAFIGVGIALGAAFGAVPVSAKDDTDDASRREEQRDSE